MSGSEALEQPRKPQRLFFALWPSAEVREQLIRISKSVARHSDGKRTQDDNLHITLRFLGSVSEDQLPCIEQVANSINLKPFELVLDQLVFKKRQEMIWLTTQQPLPTELEGLVSQLETGLQECGFAHEKYTYKPHITLIRKCLKSKELTVNANVNWFADAFVLVSSKTWATGVEYSILKEWRL